MCPELPSHVSEKLALKAWLLPHSPCTQKRLIILCILATMSLISAFVFQLGCAAALHAFLVPWYAVLAANGTNKDHQTIRTVPAGSLGIMIVSRSIQSR